MASQIRLTQTDGVEIALSVDSIEVVMLAKHFTEVVTLVGMKSGRNFTVTEAYEFVADTVADIMDIEAGRAEA